MRQSAPSLPALAAHDLVLLEEGRHPDPFAVLGRHAFDGGSFVRAFLPGCNYAELVTGEGEERSAVPMITQGDGIFQVSAPAEGSYRLRISWPDGIVEAADPYAFGLSLSEDDIYLFAEGRHFDLSTRLGANPWSFDGVDGVLFAVWAPNAAQVAVVGDFNSWDARRHPMRRRLGPGIWELFIPGIGPGAVYKYAIITQNGEKLPWKADPLGRRHEEPPRTGSIVAAAPDFCWSDAAWLEKREHANPMAEPLAIYEVHVGSWLRTEWGRMGSWDEACDRLIPYLEHMGFSHVELLPITEHPFGGSWGYQPLGLFAPTARLGPPEAFARFVDRCHAAGIGVILDWVPAHFPSDEHGLARFDGTALYEHEDPRQGFHRDWNTLIYNVGRREVRGFLIASALWWLETFHLDGLRVDAVASMLYRDYSREPGEWVPNHLGGRENFEAISFFQELNTLVGARGRGAITIAEESTAWPGVTAPVHHGGLGFHFKWNMGWMHDTLRYFARDPIHRGHHGDDVTFGLIYAFSENFVLPISHDEVVHGKGSLLSRMPGDDWQRFANLRLCLSLMWTHPGKKLLFMGCEFGQEEEWNVDAPFPWPADDDARRRGTMQLVRDLNALYRGTPSLHRLDHSSEGFNWLIADDQPNAVFAFTRSARDGRPPLLVIANMTPVPRHDYRIGVAAAGAWAERLNSDAEGYGGAGLGNGGHARAEPIASHGQAQSLSLTLPPLALLVLEHAGVVA
ncbi:1,4-alpha-glucan branching enzyme [Bosea sp. BE271]|uniref:1,4-alpha-glucan branching protein GlgB n=1 Tax=Bosea TaxID=85413 RepID=UPI00285D01C9|nr:MULTISPECIES: 1,4-alpha-glucan branching protein GlgB [Bosea]MDR6830947.1 1,4-alpha-glucan branching enzyme [Bosea robiniae]MDR6897322.1 1,4-alpha-glucan branching enzyme [Bosea sp. BE109]MDR7140719.1 1,4-alpha-glucan branching enzyme [Bosea sp. BE168]MDR7177811.1 1,4-alpha-glucan branching enzyme [Bosea sp. BE271]